jgi:hypothetical protein
MDSPDPAKLVPDKQAKYAVLSRVENAPHRARIAGSCEAEKNLPGPRSSRAQV